jgi:hypothetical protein
MCEGGREGEGTLMANVLAAQTRGIIDRQTARVMAEREVLQNDKLRSSS